MERGFFLRVPKINWGAPRLALFEKACLVLPKPRAKGAGIAEGGPSELLTPDTVVPLIIPQTSFITFFLYRPHRHQIAILQQFPDSAASKIAPVSRDGPNIRRKTIFGGSLTSRRQV